MTTVALISDTHGLLRPSVAPALADVDAIIHAGDFDEPHVLDAMHAFGPPLTAVRGNCDHGAWADPLPETAVVTLGGVTFYVIHDLGLLDIEPAAAGIDVVVYGHSHRPEVAEREGVLYVNPGSAGPRRFRLPIEMARVRIDGATIDVKPIPLAE